MLINKSYSAQFKLKANTVQFFMQLVAQRFWPLQGILKGAMTRATCQTPLRDKLHEKLHRVTGPLANALRSIVWTKLSRFSTSTVSYRNVP